VLLRPKRSQPSRKSPLLRASPVLSAPLKASSPVRLPCGDGIAASALLGRAPRSVVRSLRDVEYRVYEPTLEEHVLYSPRLVTPVSRSMPRRR
jgi:hypothetical protein